MRFVVLGEILQISAFGMHIISKVERDPIHFPAV